MTDHKRVNAPQSKRWPIDADNQKDPTLAPKMKGSFGSVSAHERRHRLHVCSRED